ncbi:hypothetical protein JOB18_009849 [Solea senegalensis]|uniref:Uncharacterized protein n=1 Tax=Solea senegalensis TaxID=28829 RepID=A0AAV6T435_SOLSE|nr:hypothetical protein JOB18_009849 [Solea senegalensis]
MPQTNSVNDILHSSSPLCQTFVDFVLRHWRHPDVTVSPPRLFEDMMDESSASPFCHPDAQLGDGYSRPLWTERVDGAASVTQQTTLTLVT